MSVTPTADCLKKVMRIAMVGIRPADQVLLKGYMRVLLRLEADLEWVSANSPQVDLFMINQEFHQAESVQRLLSAQANVSVLYIDRDELDQGKLAGNKLTLPLKEIDQLNQWLFNHVPFLKGEGNTSSQPISRSENTTPAPRQTLDDIIASRNANASSNPTAPTTPLADTSPTLPIAPTPPSLQPIIGMLQKIQERNDSLFALSQTDKVIAYLNPKSQKIWVMDDNATISHDWQINATTQQPSNLTNEQATDLAQWLWTKAYNHPTVLIPLLQPTERYHLTSWIKPLDNDHRHDILKIQGVLEAREVTVTELIKFAQVNREQAIRGLLGLMVAGVMSPVIYKNLSLIKIQPPSAPKAPNPSATIASHVSAATTTEIPQTSDNLVTSNNLATSLDTNLDTLAADTPPPPVAAEQNDGMKGFLSKLRRKLGL